MRNLSLRYVLLLALLLGLLVPSWLAFVYERTEVEQRLSLELESDRDRYADLLAVSLREPLWQLAPLFAEPMVDKIMEDPKVSHIVVRRLPEGQVFLERSKGHQSEKESATREIKMQGNTLGNVTVEVTKAGITGTVANAQQRFMWRTALVIAASIVLIFLALHWRLTRPIDKLVQQSEALAQGRLNEVTTWVRHDELGLVGHSLENTRAALAKLVGELQKVNDDLRMENEQRKKAELAISRHAGELETRVNERTQELSDANATLSVTLSDLRETQNHLLESKKLASLGRMVAGIAHELNTPIGNALTVGSAMGEKVQLLHALTESGQLKKSTLAEFIASTVEASGVLERSLSKAAALVNKFKKVAERGTDEKQSTYDIADVIAEAAANFRSVASASGVLLQLDVPAGVFVTGFPDLLGQVVGNLLNNTLEHAFDGKNGGNVKLVVRSLQHKVELRVSDDGVGIEAAIQGRIFDPLFTTRMGRGGIGLGLSMVHSIVTSNLGGTVTVEDAIPCGACFVVTVPLVAPLQPLSA